MPEKIFKEAIIDYFHNEFCQTPCSILNEYTLVSRLACYGNTKLGKKQYVQLKNWFIYAQTNLPFDVLRIQQEIGVYSSEENRKKADILLIIENNTSNSGPNGPYDELNWLNWYYSQTVPFEGKYYVLNNTHNKNNYIQNTIGNDLQSDFLKWSGSYNGHNYALGFCVFFGTPNVPTAFKPIQPQQFVNTAGGKFLFLCEADPQTGKLKNSQIYQL